MITIVKVIEMPGTKYYIEQPKNEPVKDYLPGSPERQRLREELATLKSVKIEIPLIIGGKEVKTDDLRQSVMPHDHNTILAEYHNAGETEVEEAIQAALGAREGWVSTPWYDRAAIFMKAANLMAGPYRARLNAAAMLGISKTVYQAEIDTVELVDFLRFNAFYMTDIYRDQVTSGPGEWNYIDYRALEGFIFAVTPFNFISIMGNLPTAPAMMGNVSLWKPASSAVYPTWQIMRVLLKAGVPPGVVNYILGPGSKVGKYALSHPSLAGIHFTGSTSTFNHMWRTVGENIDVYRTYPRLVGETGGKDFIVVHETAEVEPLVTALVRGAFEYSGQKCSAASRTYIPESLWPEVRKGLEKTLDEIKMGDPEDFTTFTGAVIDRAAYDNIVSYIEHAQESADMEIIKGGSHDASKGYFVEPTLVLTTDPKAKLMEEEIFGPILTIYIYPDDQYEQILHLCDETSPYGLTGSVFARSRKAISLALEILRDAAGNAYVNDKPTGAVVGRQPFGGARKSGTNDKAGSKFNLIRWVSPRSIKENFVPPASVEYDYMSEP